MNAQRRLSSRKPGAQAHGSDCKRTSAGFTLVELLVVITIIGILAGLAVPAIFSAISTANSTAMKMELNSLETAVQKYQEKYGDYPPDFSDWAVVERYYRKIFPRISGDLVLLKTLLTDTNGYNPTIMDRGEVLTWVLRGYSNDPLRPFTGPGGPLELVGMGGQAGDIPIYQINPESPNQLFEFNPAQLDLSISTRTRQSTSTTTIDPMTDLFSAMQPPRNRNSSCTSTPARRVSKPVIDIQRLHCFWRPDAGPVRPYISDIVKTDHLAVHETRFVPDHRPGIDGSFGWLSKQNGTTGPNDADTVSVTTSIPQAKWSGGS